MNHTWPSDIVFLGAGGENPRVEAIMADTGETRKIIELPPMHSAYAMDVNWETGTLVVGTKGGLIHVMANTKIEKAGHLPSEQELVQGAPVLSLCWANKSLLAVSDITGRCLLWHMNQEASPQSLEVTEGIICSLINLPDGRLSGLSSEGILMFWEPSGYQLERVIEIPCPPSISALVSIVYWPVEDALVYPDLKGRLIVFNLKTNDIRCFKAHEGSFYAISVWDESLMSVGMEDYHLRIWPPGSEKADCEIKVPGGVISVDIMGAFPAKLVLIDTQGSAGVYTLQGKDLEFINPLPGENYRVAVAQPPERIKAVDAKKRAEEVRQIVQEIENGTNRIPEDIIDGLHSRLIGLGFKHISLALRAKWAEQKGDFVEGLRFCSALMPILPQDNPHSCPSMERYAMFLKKTWQILEADDVCSRILAINPTYSFGFKPEELTRISKLMNDRPWVIEPDIPIDQIIGSAIIIDKRFYGRYVIKKLEPMSCERVKLSPRVIAQKYEQVQKEFGEGSFPAAQVEKVWWFSTTDYKEVDIVVFGNGHDNDVEGLQFVLQVWYDTPDTMVVPVVLFDWHNVQHEQSVKEENERASQALVNIKKRAQPILFLTAINRALKHALRRLISESLSQRGSR